MDTKSNEEAVTNSANPLPKKEMSKGAKIGLIVLGIVILFGIITSVIGGLFVKSIPTLFKLGLEKEGVKVDESNGNVTINDEKTNTQLETGSDLDLPKNFPTDIPVFSPSSIVFKMSQEKDGNVTLSSTKSASEILSYYESEMNKKGWTEDSSMEINDYTQLVYQKGSYTVGLVIGDQTDNENETSLTISYTYENN